MNDGELTPAEIATGLTADTKRRQEEASGVRDVDAITANERAYASAARTILASARRFKRALSWRGKVT